MNLTDLPWFKELRPASFRRVPFGVFGGQFRVGRRVAIHEYPQRDTVWVEDLGRATRRIALVGFVVGDNAMAQRDQLVLAAEQGQSGPLMHPTLGELTVTLIDIEIVDSKDHGRAFELSFTFVESGERVFPGASVSTQAAAVVTARAAADVAGSSFVGRLRESMRQVIVTGQQLQATAASWVRQAQGFVDDATNLYHYVTGLPGNFGRFVNSSVTSLTAGTLSDLIAAGSANRTAVANAVAAVTDSAAVVTNTDASLSAFAVAAQALVDAVLASCANPADAIRLLLLLSAFDEPVVQGTEAAAAQMQALNLFHRLTIAAIARAVSTYKPSSYDDAAALRTLACDEIDEAITAAGDSGDDTALLALRALRAAVSLDLTTRGADLARVETFTFQSPLPSLVLAQRLYRDPTRADELVAQANPIHPAFMPVTFRALSQ